MKKKAIILCLPLIINFTIIPFFLDINIEAKRIVLSLIVIFFSIFSFKKVHSVTYPSLIIFVFCLISLFRINPYNNYSLPVFIIALIVFFEYLRNLKDEFEFEKFIDFYIIFSVVICCLGLYEYFSFALLGVSDGQLIPYILPKNTSMRVGGIFGQPNLFALPLVLAIFCFYYKYIHSRSFRLERKSSLWWFQYLPFFLVSVVFFLTGSRSGLVALVFVLFFLLHFIYKKKYLVDKTLRKRFFFLSGILLITLCCAMWLDSYFSQSSMVERGLSSGNQIEARFTFYAAAALIFLNNIWFGVGLDNFQFHLPAYLEKAHSLLGFVQYESMGYTRWAHNEILQLVSECGLFALIFIFFLLYLCGKKYLFLLRFQQVEPSRLYLYALMIPFFIQAMLSWPLRHPGLIVIFVILLNYFVNDATPWRFAIHGLSKKLFVFTLCCLLTFNFCYTFQQYYTSKMVKDIRSGNLEVVMDKLDQYSFMFINKYDVLNAFLPQIVKNVISSDNVNIAHRVLPYLKKSTKEQGVHWQYYNLAIVQLFLGDESKSKVAIKRAIDLSPVKESYWNLLHYIHVLKAARETGKSIDKFIPLDNNGVKTELHSIVRKYRDEYDGVSSSF